MKRKSLVFMIIGSVSFLAALSLLLCFFVLPVMVNGLLHSGLSFPEKSEPSHDGALELRQYSKDDEDGVNSLYFYITKAGDKDPLFVSDCEYRLFDFQSLEWGVGTYDVWAVSGDIGTYFYRYQQDGTWKRYGLDHAVRSTDEVWTLEGLQIDRKEVPQEVIDYMTEWEAKE